MMTLKNHKRMLYLILIIFNICAPSMAAERPSMAPPELTKIEQDEIYVDKTTNRSDGEYYKGDYIKVILNIRANYENPSKIKRVNIQEDIIEEFDLIEIKPGHKSHYMSWSQRIVWEFNDLNDLKSSGDLSYIIKTNESGEYTLGTTELSTETQDSGMTIYLYPSPDITVVNRPPSISNVNYISGTMWQGDKRYIHAVVGDPDGDNVYCELWSNGHLLIGPPNITTNEDIHHYTWDLSDCNAGVHKFTLKANDTDNGISEIGAGELEITKKLFGMLPVPDEHKWSILTGITVGIIISNIPLVWANIRTRTRRKNHQKEATSTASQDEKQIIDSDTKKNDE